jgi:hypothetical protein
MKNCVMIAVVVMVGICSSAMGTIVEVGNGGNFANLTINWSDGYVAEFKVLFASETISGADAMGVIDSALSNFSTVVYGSGTSAFIDGISYAGHSNEGYAGGENWWHYWTMESGDASWTSSWIGAGQRVLTSGDSDGWVYGNAGDPIPEPMTLAMLGLGMVLAVRKK